MMKPLAERFSSAINLPAEKGVPTETECRDLWVRFEIPDEVTFHSRMVAELARIFAVYLRGAGLKFDIDLILAGGYLHELFRTGINEAAPGAKIFQEMGYTRVCEVLSPPIESLMDGAIDEGDLIYLAERCIEDYGSRLLVFRYGSGNLPASRVNRTEVIRGRVEKILGISLGSITRKHERGILAVSVQGIRDVYLLVTGALRLKTGVGCTRTQELALCPEGIQQARTLRDELEAVPLSSIYCSDFRSAVETAAIVAEPHGIVPKVRTRLGEMEAGGLDGLASTNVKQLYCKQFAKDRMDFDLFGEDTLLEYTARVIPEFYDILNSTFGNMVIVGHPIVNRIILCQVMGASLERLFELDQSPGNYNLIHCNGPNMRLKVLNGDDRSDNRFN